MILILDGYNILKRHHGIQFVDERERSRFLSELASYARQSGNKIIVVFDGVYDEDEKYGRNVRVVYSGSRETADDYIKRYVQTHAAKDLMLVSSDRELNRLADRHQVPSLDAHEFIRVLQYSRLERSSSSGSSRVPVIKISDESTPEVDMLMEQGSKIVPQKSEDITRSNKRTSQKLSKKERELLKKVKKL